MLPIDVDRGVFPLLFPEVHNHLLSFVDVECKVIFLTPHSEGPMVALLKHVGTADWYRD